MALEDCDLFSISDKPETNTNSRHIPAYHVTHVYDIDANPEDEGKPKRARLSRNACFNCCGSGHSLRQCPMPYNQRQISKNRASFGTRNEFKRYHVELQDETFPKLKPGVISDKLREALGLSEEQLPMYIYRMRTLGYPPGWLLNAVQDTSGIEMFDMEGNRVPNVDEEEGEIGGSKTCIYDESKIISFPGFNEWPVPGTLDNTQIKDVVNSVDPTSSDETEPTVDKLVPSTSQGTSKLKETDHYNVPELKYMQSKEDFIKTLKTTNVAMKSKTKVSLEAIACEGECDMETDDIHDEGNALPEDGLCKFIPPLPEEPENQPPPPPADPEDGEIQEEEDEPKEKGAESFEDVEEPSPIVIEENLLSKLENSSHGRIVSIELGTPVLKIHSPYSKLPPSEAFQKDITDVINFENLPDSTGAYEKLKDVLKSVRNRMSLIKENKLNATI